MADLNGVKKSRVVSGTNKGIPSISLFLPWINLFTYFVYFVKIHEIVTCTKDSPVANNFILVTKFWAYRLFAVKVTYLKIISNRKKLLLLRRRVLFSISNYFDI
jgi:hypothetical protein